MKRYILIFYLLFFITGFAQDGTRRPDPVTLTYENERITSFHSDIDVDKDGTLTVTEAINVHSLGNEIRRGIYRALPLSRNLNQKSQKVQYDILSVKKDGVDEDYHEETSNGFLEIYIGSKDVILSPGDYGYEIKYKTKNQIGFFDTYDELYWNVNGNQWKFNTDSISTKVHLPAGAAIIQNSCYTGTYGSNSQNCASDILPDGSIEWNASGLAMNEGFTIAVGFKKGVVLPPPPPTFIEKYGILIAGIFLFAGLLIYYYRTWKKYGIDPEKPVMYPQFGVPEELSPASLGYIRKESFRNNMVTAALVNLAVRGFVQIVESEDSGLLGLFNTKVFVVKKLREPDQSIAKEEINLMNNLFSGGKNSVKFDGKYNKKIENAVNSFKSSLEYQHDKFLNEGNNRNKLWFPVILITLVYTAGLFLSFMMDRDPAKIIIGFTMYIILAVIFVLFTFLVKNFSWKLLIPLPVIFIIGISAYIGKSNDLRGDYNFSTCYIFIVLSFISLIIFQYLVKRPSEEKLKRKTLIDGFKMYMGTAENEQLKFHNPPQITPQVFETLLPFAMVLGVDAIWGEKFEKAMQNMSMPYTHAWYVGSAINHYSFGNMLNSSLTNSIQSASTQPSSSGSGSGGGGFSGGGGGGGGGGGW